MTFLALIIALSYAISGQENRNLSLRAPTATLIDSFHWSGGDEAEARLQQLLAKLSEDPHSHGYIYVYCGQTCFYGEPMAHFRGIHEGLAFLKYDPARVSLVFGGFMEKATTELWFVPQGAHPPVAKPTIATDKVTFIKSKRKVNRPYWCC